MNDTYKEVRTGRGFGQIEWGRGSVNKCLETARVCRKHRGESNRLKYRTRPNNCQGPRLDRTVRMHSTSADNRTRSHR